MKIASVFGNMKFFLPVILVWLWFCIPKTAFAALVQNDYRFYVNANALTPTDPWPSGATNLGENSAATGINGLVSGDVVRIRITLNASGSSEANHVLKMQYKIGSTCSAAGTWSDVGGLGSGTIWRGYDNANVTEESTLSTLLLSVADIAESYEEASPTVSMPGSLTTGQDGEWDFVLQNNGASEGVYYCFRLTKSDGTALDSYDDYPQIETKAFVPKSNNWRFYDDETNETPTIALASENAQPFGQPINDPIKLRFTLTETGGLTGVDQVYRLQYSTTSDFSSGVAYVDEIGSCSDSSLWCYANGVDTDDTAISTSVLTDSTSKGVHRESGTSTSTYDHQTGASTEFEFTIMSKAGVSGDTVYYFRAYDFVRSLVVALNTGETYPNIKTRMTTLSFSIAGVSSGTTIDGWTTNINTTATSIPFGTLTPNNPKIGAQRLTVSTDGEGYTLYILADGNLRTTGGILIPGTQGTNSAPVSWGFSRLTGSGFSKGSFGYHPDDNVLSDSSTRFEANDSWARTETTGKEIVYTSSPVINDVHDLLFQVEVGSAQDQGFYSAEIQIIAIPIF